jgi:hypothetical protein
MQPMRSLPINLQQQQQQQQQPTVGGSNSQTNSRQSLLELDSNSNINPQTLTNSNRKYN